MNVGDFTILETSKNGRRKYVKAKMASSSGNDLIYSEIRMILQKEYPDSHIKISAIKMNGEHLYNKIEKNDPIFYYLKFYEDFLYNCSSKDANTICPANPTMVTLVKLLT